MDPFEETVGCCVQRHRFSDLYPSSELTGNVDAGYLRWGEKRVFFYKGDNVYKADLFEVATVQGYNIEVWQPDVRAANLTNAGPWNVHWNDLCDVLTYTHSQCHNAGTDT